MNISILLADVGRPAPGSGLNLLNVGWSFTFALQPPNADDGRWVLPPQAVAVFFELWPGEIGVPQQASLQLLDPEGAAVGLGYPVEEYAATAEFVVLPPPGAPDDIPITHSLLLEFPTGSIRIPGPGRYCWQARIGDTVAERVFWVASAVPSETR